MNGSRSNRVLNKLLIAWFFLAVGFLAWLLMCGVHEFGHALHAWMSGGSVRKVVLHPLAISRTDVNADANLRFVAWGGFVWGTAIPLALWAATFRSGNRRRYYVEFFCGFCLAANGAYLTTGMWSPAGDTWVLRSRGESPVVMAVVGAVLAAAGIWQWHRLDKHAKRNWVSQVSRRDIAGVTICLAIVIIGELLLFPAN